MPAVKKLVNIFFSLVLVMGLLPVTAFASPSQGAEEGASGKAVVVDQGNANEPASGSGAPSSDTAAEGGTTSAQTSGANSGKSDNNSDQNKSQDAQNATSSQENSDLENSWRYTNGELTVQDDNGGIDTYSGDSSRSGKAVVRKGIDVSEHNGTIDWEKVKADGVDFAILRVGFIHDNGRGRSDYQWERNVSECERLGIPYGVYVYSYAETASHASTEADFVLQRLKGHNPSYPVYYDLEDNCQLSVAQNHGMGALAQTFCNKIAAAGYTPGVYANTNWWTNYLTDSCFGNWEKWVAQYNSSCTYKGSYSIWQYTSSGHVNGIDGRVDMNFDYEKNRAFDDSYRLEIAPKNVKASASGSGEVTLTWDAVDGADAYAVAEYVDGGYRTFTTSCSSTSYKVSDLSNGKKHGFLVQARVGGKWSAVSTDLLAYATPQGATKPEPKAEPGNGSVKLTWDKVPGATAYAVASRNDDGSYKTYTLSCTGTSYEVGGLANGKSYGFLVQAKLDGAWSSFDSSDLVSATPWDPSSPKNVKASASGSGEVTLTWDAVDGADAYAVAEYVDGGYRTFTTSCSSTSYKVSDLSNGKKHGFLVQARVGGKWSAVSTDLLAYATPQGATKPEPKAEPGNGSVKLTWDKVPGATKYAVMRNDTVTAAYVEDCSYEARGLKNGTSYGFRVRALIDGAWTPVSDDVVWATPADADSPKANAALNDDGSVTLKWGAVSGADHYAVALKTGSGYSTYTYSCTQTEYTVNGLNPGTYSFLVQAHVSGRWSSFTEADIVTIRIPDSNSPVVSVDYPDSDSAELSWSPVPGATKYAIAEYRNGSFVNYSTECTDTKFMIRNLGIGKKHRYLVQAYVDGSWSKYSNDDLVEAMIADKNSPNVKAEASGDGQVTLSWDEVSGATKYAIAEYVDGGYRTYTTACNALSYSIDDLGNGHEHSFLVQAYVGGKWSTASTDLLVSATPHGVMSPTATAKAGDLSATLQWNKVPGATKYAVAAQNGDGSFTTYTYSCTGTSYIVNGLASGRTYRMLVQAYVDGAWSPFSTVDLVSVKPYGTNVPAGQQMMSDIANNSGFTSGTSYLILVNRSRHEVGVFKGGYNNWSCIKFWSCVTGAPSTPTITGTYSTTGFKRTNLTTDARARWATQINGGYFFHSILASNNELGSSQSHGCIRLAVENAKWIYDNIWQGTKVYIY